MRAMIVEPMQPPRIEEIEPTLRNLQSIVGGYIEIVPAELGDSALVICNEEGKIDNLPPNRFVYEPLLHYPRLPHAYCLRVPVVKPQSVVEFASCMSDYTLPSSDSAW